MTEQKTLTTTFKQKIASGEVKRADMMKCRLEDLYVEEGFNLRTPFDQLEGEALQEVLDADEALYEFIKAGGQIPPLEVRPRAEGGVWVVEGHRRRRVLMRCDAEGVPLRDGKPVPGGDPRGELWVKIESFTGDDADRKSRILTSQDNLKLHAVEIANGYLELSKFGWTNERIANLRKKTPQHVAQYLIVAGADTYVKWAIRNDKIAFTEAVKIVRKHGDGAAQFIKDKLSGAGKKLTAATIGSKNLPKKIVDEVEASTIFVIDNLTAEASEAIAKAALSPEQFADEIVEIRAGDLAELLKAVNAIKEERAKQAEKRAEAAGIDPRKKTPSGLTDEEVEEAQS
ncbi:ParB-like nuclease domain [Burkholderia phage BcepF1]|uniref:ParB-like nuclease domain n=1 Tax=Burkholderia phage BcepF1 TaxID=2886897 RepID=A1YZR3_9CAUD|nr:ParB-like partition protein [Burkholderia phage BcepF1]ABL96740.1 ParB-like nuclease domain [Burkholderia phage BcepF1]